MSRTLSVVLVPQSEGGCFVDCPALPGRHSQGDTKEEAIENIREAIALVLDDMEDPGEQPLRLPDPIVTQVRIAG